MEQLPMKRGACTIVSSNYLPYARTLCESYLAFHPNDEFFVLLVDHLPEGFDTSREEFHLVFAEDLGIADFRSVAFKFGLVELNTNVKPTFLKNLLSRGFDQVIYFDPDILICSPVDLIYKSLATSSIVLTPHCTSPNTGDPYAEIMLLVNGVYNLGFVAVSKAAEASRFLTWWEERCLTHGYSERWSGLFVDQKWINLVPCYFESVDILKHPGCNVAYWNVHERTLQRVGTGWQVNGSAPLVFFHFSGVYLDDDRRVTRYANQFTFDSRPDLTDLFLDYRVRLRKHGIHNSARHQYAYGSYDNGTPINKLQRAAFAANLETFGKDNPFDANGSFYKWAKRSHLQSSQDSLSKFGNFGRNAYTSDDTRVRIVNTILRLALRVLGADRYSILMKYFEYVSVLRNQKDVLRAASQDE
jgi:hypothetical protein